TAFQGVQCDRTLSNSEANEIKEDYFSQFELHICFGLLPAGHSSSTDVSPSPSETSGLLSLLWEIIAIITSHLPAHCVLNVLPKVRPQDLLTQLTREWQLCARKLVGSRCFPLGPKENFNWPEACIELEQLLSLWTKYVHPVSIEIPYHEAARGPDVPQQPAEVCATASRDNNVMLWELEAGPEGALLHTLTGKHGFTTHQGLISCLDCQGPLLASGGFDSTVRLWDLQAGGACPIRRPCDSLCKCSTAVSCASNSLFKILNLHGSPVMSLAADDKYIISGGRHGAVVIYDRRADKTLKNIKLEPYLKSMNGKQVWGGDCSGMLHCFSMQPDSFGLVSDFDVGRRKKITGIHKSSGSLYTCSDDRTVKVGRIAALVTLPDMSVQAGVLAVATGGEIVEVWRPRR
uniref:F-box and WD repeat domain containing 9 n=1 Tax=Salarias fasciatus TaxID=181472 RepID=A0A672H9A9_SALFA